MQLQRTNPRGRRTNFFWYNGEEDFIADCLLQDIPFKIIASALGRTTCSVQIRASNKGMTKWSIPRRRIIDGNTFKTIQRLLKRHKVAELALLRKHGL